MTLKSRPKGEYEFLPKETEMKVLPECFVENSNHVARTIDSGQT